MSRLPNIRAWYPIAAAATAGLASLVTYSRLPERMPVHWAADGHVDRYGSRFEGAFVLPLIILFVALVAGASPRLDPRGASYDKFRPTYHVAITAVATMLLVGHFMALAVALGVAVPVARLVPVSLGLLLIIIGNVLPRTRPNWLFGIRTPWTLSSDRVWERTHRVGGYLLVGAGVLVALAAPTRAAGPVALGALLGAAAVTTVFSYLAWRQESRL